MPSLYRIDTPLGPVRDLVGPCLFRSKRVAIERARECLGSPAEVTRIGTYGHTKLVASVDTTTGKTTHYTR